VTVTGTGVVYGFNLTVAPGITYYIDPEVATGYIYQTGSGNPNFASVELPNIGNPDPYDLYLWNGAAFVFDTALAADTLFDFAPGGVNEFEVLGIDPGLGLDPDNTTAFITALTFEGAGDFTGTMTPITTDVSAPEPGSLTLLASGLLGLGLLRRRRGRLQAVPTASIQ
jgi:PEP-CTERM motif-containing protein